MKAKLVEIAKAAAVGFGLVGGFIVAVLGLFFWEPEFAIIGIIVLASCVGWGLTHPDPDDTY